MASCALEFGEQFRLEMIGIDRHFAGGDFFVGCALKAEFTNAEALFRTNRRTERAASHRAMRIEVAGSSFGVERGTRLVVGKVFEAALGARALIQNARFAIAGEIGGDAVKGFASAPAHASRAIGIRRLEFRKAFAQPSDIELVDGEDADTALRATGTTDKPRSRALGSVGESRVENLDELVIGAGTNERRHR